MRFDDTLETVLAADVSTPFGKAAAWRQLVDLIGRRRAAADARALTLLETIQPDVSIEVRAASARALEACEPPYGLVALCAVDDIAVAAPVLRGARLQSGEWIELLPRMSPAGRGVVRGRSDLPPGVAEALALFTADFAIGSGPATPAGAIAQLLGRIRVRPHGTSGASEPLPPTPPPPPPAPVDEPVADVPAQPINAPTSSFVSIAAAARSIPVVAAALQRAGDDATAAPGDAAEADIAPAAEVDAAPAPIAEGPFKIADVVARIDAFYTRQHGKPKPLAPTPRADGFRFETDAQGAIRWVDGVTRAPLIGLSLDAAATPGGGGVDGAVAGAFRQRAPFNNGRLIVVGNSDAAGDWRISANAAFDPATGRFAGYRGTARRPRVEEDAARARRGGQVADSLRQLMHELRTPTNAIAGFAEMIDREMLGEAPDVYRQRASTIRDHARALLGAIDDLDIAARIEASALQLHPGEVALRPLLVRVIDDLAALATVRGTSIELSAAAPIVLGDMRAVERLLSRTLATLIAAAGTGEGIAVRLDEQGDEVAIGFSRPQALAAYADDALFGIDDEQEDAALLGTGFALRLVRNLARELSGSLVVEAEWLTLRLPAAVTKSLEVVR